MSEAARIFRNGAFLHERWGDLPDATLIGVFQYVQHANELAKQLAREKQDDQCAYVVTDLYEGKQWAWTRSRMDKEQANAS